MGNCRPIAHYFHSVMSQNMEWWKALAEWIDNAVDASAKTIQIETANHSLTIQDDGTGITDVACLLTLGSHIETSQGCLGTYGVGAKDAWLSCADVMHVDSVSAGKRIQGTFDIRQIIEDDFDYEEPTESVSSAPSYTLLEFELKPGKKPPAKRAFERLAWAFTPAMWAGKRIVVKHRKGSYELKPCPMPTLVDSVNSTFSVAGKDVTINIGLTDGAEIANGPLWLCFGHRIISGTSLGTGAYSVKNIAGTIRLHEEWKEHLTKHKDDLKSSSDELEEAILQRIKPLLKEAQKASETFESVLLTNELTDLLNSTLSRAKKKGRAKRGTGKTSGTVKPKGSDRKHKHAKEVHECDGDVEERDGEQPMRKGSAYVKFSHDSDPKKMGRFDVVANTVILNENNNFVSVYKNHYDRTGLMTAVMAVIADHHVRNPNGKAVLSFAYESFADVYGGLANAYAEETANAR